MLIEKYKKREEREDRFTKAGGGRKQYAFECHRHRTMKEEDKMQNFRKSNIPHNLYLAQRDFPDGPDRKDFLH